MDKDDFAEFAFFLSAFFLAAMTWLALIGGVVVFVVWLLRLLGVIA